MREFLSNHDIAAILSRVTGKTIRYIDDVPDMPPTAPGERRAAACVHLPTLACGCAEKFCALQFT